MGNIAWQSDKNLFSVLLKTHVIGSLVLAGGSSMGPVHQYTHYNLTALTR